jgi:hypothetical protein
VGEVVAPRVDTVDGGGSPGSPAGRLPSDVAVPGHMTFVDGAARLSEVASCDGEGI